jgi:acylphosphatase/uncharacterized protein YoxC
MKRLIACVSGQVQKVGYRKRVMQTAKAFGLKGIVENLEDGRVRIIVEGEDEKLKWFESAIDIKNTLIQVSTIEKAYFAAGGEFIRFGKVVDENETDSRLDKGVEAISSMILAINGVTRAIERMDSNLSRKIDNIGEKIDTMSGKIDSIDGKMGLMLQKQDDLIVEVKDMNASLNEKMDRVLDKTDVFELKSDMSDVKTALRAKGII